MTEYSFLTDLIKTLGVSGLIIWVVYKLVDKWAGRFLGAQQQQAEAMADLAAAVREGQGEQRELLIAVRVLATKVDETKAWVKELSDHVLGRRPAA